MNENILCLFVLAMSHTTISARRGVPCAKDIRYRGFDRLRVQVSVSNSSFANVAGRIAQFEQSRYAAERTETLAAG